MRYFWRLAKSGYSNHGSLLLYYSLLGIEKELLYMKMPFDPVQEEAVIWIPTQRISIVVFVTVQKLLLTLVEHNYAKTRVDNEKAIFRHMKKFCR